MEVPLATLSWKLAWRYLRRHPQRKRLAFASVVSTAGVTLGVAALVVVMSILAGLAEFISKSVKAVDAPIAILSANSSPLPDDSSFISSLRSLPQVRSVSPYIEGEAVARMPSRNIEAGCLVRGVTENNFLTAGLDTMLIWGSPPSIRENNLPGAVLGVYLSEDFMHSVGDTILFFPPSAFFSSGRTGVGRAVLTGSIETGLPVNDRKIVYLPLETASRMFLPGGGYTGLFIELDKDFTLDQAVGALEEIVPDSMNVLTWQQRNPALYASLKLERLGAFAAILLITLVASFNITGTIARSVVERRRDIAVLKAMGASRQLILRVFLWEGLLVGFTGAISGILLGLAGCWLIESTSIIQLPDVYSFHDTFPMKISFQAVFTAGGAAVLISLLAALVPAARASSLEPTKGLRQ
ncbi:MAG: ABC transporter permease [Candidatus Sabulitectum sp.]|nr:ABC transporter permease [Candidatus Sabulitectum sp.]